MLFHEGTSCAAFMWLLEGTVRVFKTSEEGREVTVYRVSPGELCLLTLNSLLRNERYPASAKSETFAKGLMISAQQFHASMDRSRGFSSYVLQALVERLTDVMSLLSDVTFHRIHLRAACFLGQQFERAAGMPLQLTHAQLASELGTTREVISRILKEFERQQCISLHRGQIHLVSQDGLKWFAENRTTLQASG
jgi:CRP/FNR family transcriptional regulator